MKNSSEKMKMKIYNFFIISFHGPKKYALGALISYRAEYITLACKKPILMKLWGTKGDPHQFFNIVSDFGTEVLEIQLMI